MDHTPTPSAGTTGRHHPPARAAVHRDPVLAIPPARDTALGSGSTLAVYLPPGTPERVRDLLHEQIAGLLSRTRRGFGPQVVWRPGNPLDLPE
ncbi:hypothetical protein ABH931_007074 [Streptacidiphilus sp. MAP12-33]|uniref:hypothetical protein n=1 Tax=Streptacidiphilus sp. MAP12-33 TaxID=3156266 RepID=UPI0035159336